MKKKLPEVLVILSIIILGIIVEVFGFNFKYFRLDSNEKGIVKINENDIVADNFTLDESKLTITGENPSFKINGSKYINYLNIKLMDENKILKITPEKEGISLSNQKTYSGDLALKSNSYIKVNDYSDNVKFKIGIVNKDNTETGKKDNSSISMEVDSVYIDNTFTFNVARYIFIISLGLLAFYFIHYRNIVKEKLHISFVVISLCIGMNFVFMMPTYYSHDEREHFIKAYELANFDIVGESKAIGWPENIDTFFGSNGIAPIFDSYKEKVEYQDKFTDNNYSKDAIYKTTASTYPFVPYIPGAIGIGIGLLLKLSFITSFYLGRITGLVICTILGALIIKHTKIAKRLIFMIMLLPSVLYHGAAYSADAVTLISSMAAMVIFINIIGAKERSIGYKEIGFFLVAISVLIMSKFSYAPLCLLILAVPKMKLKEKLNVWTIKLGTLFLSGCVTILTLVYGLSKDANQWKVPGVDVKGQVLFIFHNIFTYLHIAINEFIKNIQEYLLVPGNLAYTGNIKVFYIYIMVFILFVVAIIDNEENIIKIAGKDKLVISLATIIAWGLVDTALYVTFTPVGSKEIAGVQGRYIIPLLLPILLIFKNNKIITNYKKENLNYLISVFWVFTLIISMGMLFSQYNG
ncbi:DUF2142 domain-containing protein [Clostridium sp. Sa3CVN1]|uniref:DUF2142 domain-containing protein n=1 Tax=Clostridium cibarium TaxID=2762247 RepID=A0ABR8PPV9_9CLOT|nr:DUF2142 domain-containing protein [Clostridium cibarium]